MEKNIQNVSYNTANATMLGSFSRGSFREGDGYQEQLYKTPEGRHFIYGFGGSSSPYPIENIHPVNTTDAMQWLNSRR